jgi:hypothetical protein
MAFRKPRSAQASSNPRTWCPILPTGQGIERKRRVAGATSVEVLAASSWDFGWEALVAVATLLLAAATFFLARRTATLAESSEAEVRAQWRPLILPGLDPPGPPSKRALAYDLGNGVATRAGAKCRAWSRTLRTYTSATRRHQSHALVARRVSGGRRPRVALPYSLADRNL